MTAIPNNLGTGGAHLNSAHGAPDLKSLLNGLAYDVTQIRGAAPAAVTSPVGTTLPAVTAPVGTTLPASVLSDALAAYAAPASPTDVENAADRTAINNLRTEVAQLRTYAESMRLEVVQLRAYTESLRTEVVAYRAAQTARAGVTLRTTVSADYT